MYCQSDQIPRVCFRLFVWPMITHRIMSTQRETRPRRARCAAMFEGRSDICVPPVVREQTSERVLTMRFEPVRRRRAPRYPT